MNSNHRGNICISLLIGLLSIVFTKYANAANYTVTQVTNNDYEDLEPDISNDEKIVWYAPVGNTYPMQVLLYSGGSIQQLTNFNNGYVRLARIGSNGHVAWLYGSEIHYYDGVSTQIIGDHVHPCCGSFFEEPDINASGNIVWVASDGFDWEIFLFDGATAVNLSNDNLSAAGDPIIADNGHVVWRDWDGSDWEVYLYNGSTTQQFTNNSGIQDALPHINASGQIAWVANWNDPVTTQVKSAIYFYDGVNTIKVDETDSGTFSSVKISDTGQLFYLHPISPNSGDMRVYLYDNGSSVNISGAGTWAYGLQVNSNGQAVWRGYDGSDYEIFVYDGNTTIQLTNNNDNDVWPRINNNGQIVWGQNSETGETICDPFDPFGWCYPVFTDHEIFLATPKDMDRDGIFNEVDTLPYTFSDDFADLTIGGTTTGSITNRGEQSLKIADAVNPAGVRITADPFGGAIPATVSVCGSRARLSFRAGDDAVITCSSVTVEVNSGTVEIEFIADDGTTATTSVDQGNTLTFYPDSVTFTAAPTNSSPVVVLIDGEEMSIGPGETGSAVDIDIKPGSFPNSIKLSDNGAIPVAVFSTEAFDATLIDPGTITLNSSTVRLRGNGFAASFEDINQDGILDLVVQVDRGGFESTGDGIGTLEGMTYDGIYVKGSDSVRVIE